MNDNNYAPRSSATMLLLELEPTISNPEPVTLSAVESAVPNPPGTARAFETESVVDSMGREPIRTALSAAVRAPLWANAFEVASEEGRDPLLGIRLTRVDDVAVPVRLDDPDENATEPSFVSWPRIELPVVVDVAGPLATAPDSITRLSRPLSEFEVERRFRCDLIMKDPVSV